MKIDQVINPERCTLLEPHENNDYYFDDPGLAIKMSGVYTLPELEMLMACLKEANRSCKDRSWVDMANEEDSHGPFVLVRIWQHGNVVASWQFSDRSAAHDRCEQLCGHPSNGWYRINGEPTLYFRDL